jgi:heme exporter protein C
MLFCIIGLITGPFWARKSWGVWWTWDPRLTSVLLLAMIYVAYLVLRAFGTLGDVEKRFAAGLGILGVLNIPLIKYSVERWRGTHPTVVTGKGGGIHGDMVLPLLLSLLLFVLAAAALIWVRAQLERMRRQVVSLELDALERGQLDED